MQFNQKWGERVNKIRKFLMDLSGAVFVVIAVLLFTVRSIPNWLLWFFVVSLLLGSIVELAASSLKALTSLRGFFGYAFAFHFAIFMIAVILLSRLSISFDFGNSVANAAVVYFSLCMVNAVVWCFISLLANAAIASLANAILTAGSTVLVLTMNYVFDFVEEVYRLLPEAVAHTGTGIWRLSANTVLMPFLIMVACATVACEIKKYWVEKYNSGNDINADGVVKTAAVDKVRQLKVTAQTRE